VVGGIVGSCKCVVVAHGYVTVRQERADSGRRRLSYARLWCPQRRRGASVRLPTHALSWVVVGGIVGSSKCVVVAHGHFTILQQRADSGRRPHALLVVGLVQSHPVVRTSTSCRGCMRLVTGDVWAVYVVAGAALLTTVVEAPGADVRRVT
jgi:hypothetical protein